MSEPFEILENTKSYLTFVGITDGNRGCRLAFEVVDRGEVRVNETRGEVVLSASQCSEASAWLAAALDQPEHRIKVPE